MSAPALLYTIYSLARDTFRQAIASGIFWLMLGVSVICIGLCISTRVVGDVPLQTADGVEALPRAYQRELVAGMADQIAVAASQSRGIWQAARMVTSKTYHEAAHAQRTGVPIVHGQLELAFGAIRLEIPRDRVNTVRMLQLHLAGWVADAAGLLLALLWTAGFLPSFLEPSAVSVLLAKPVPRPVLLIGKFLGILAFVFGQACIFIFGTWLALGVRTGVWDPIYLLCVPLLLLHFAVFFSFSAMLAVATRSTVASVFGSILFWFLCWGMNYGRHMVLLTPDFADLHERSSLFSWIVEAGYWMLPKPLDFHLTLLDALQADNFFARVVNVNELQRLGDWHPVLSILSSVAAGTVLLAIAVHEFVTADY